MSDNRKETAAAQIIYKVPQSTQRLSCPTDEMILWNAHPKVYLPIAKTGEEVCPYCNSKFIFENNPDI